MMKHLNASKSIRLEIKVLCAMICVTQGVSMTLKEYLADRGMSINEFSRRIKYHQVYIGRIVRGVSIPSRRLANIIEKFTDGIVTAKSLALAKE